MEMVPIGQPFLTVFPADSEKISIQGEPATRIDEFQIQRVEYQRK